MLKRISLLVPAAVKSVLSRLRASVFDIYAVKSYSQEGEDMILRRMFENKRRGFYVDVGAHHPSRFSNTRFFYQRGWRGINIEPNPDAMRAFRSARSGDTNVHSGVSDRAELLTYHVFDEPALNTFDADIVKSRLANTPYRLLKKIDIPVERLDDILARCLPPGREIDFLSVDVEGLDIAVLRSNDWRRFRPKCVLVEVLGMSLEEILHSDVFLFMKNQGYELFAKTFSTLIFRERVAEDGGPDASATRS